jgi:phospholipid/cholesterol/gamma-HCH transport system substrate-binding protein
MKTVNNLKLGVFVLAGLFFLVLLLYMIGSNSNIFGKTYELKARFQNVHGLVVGNNIRYAGIETGTVQKIEILNDTLIEVTMNIQNRMKNIIRKTATVSIGTEGVVGNKVINLLPGREKGDFAVEGDYLVTHPSLDTDVILESLDATQQDIAQIAVEMKTILQRINNSSGLWTLMYDQTIPRNINASIANIQQATGKALHFASNLDLLLMDIQKGEGSIGALVTDTVFATQLNNAVMEIKAAGSEADSLAGEFRKIVDGLRYDINDGKGPVNAMLKDTSVMEKVNASLENIRSGTERFNQNMEAMKHHFLFRGYFKKEAKAKAKAEAKAEAKVEEKD